MADEVEKKAIKGKRGIVKQQSVDENEDDVIPPLSSEEKNILNAKMHLLTHFTEDGGSLYDHLSILLSGALEQQPENLCDDLEDLSKELKKGKLRVTQSTVRSCPPHSPSYSLAKVESRQYQSISYEERQREQDSGQEAQEEKYAALPNLMKQAHYFQMGGVGLPMEEYTRIALALRELVQTWPIHTVRFWGKVLGLKQNYYVAEADFPEGEYETDISDDEDDEDDDDEKEESIFDESATLLSMKPIFKRPPKIPCEQAGTGLNRKVYFVCSQPCQPWYRLPHVTPQQIAAARKIRKYFTGYLNHQMVTYPPFPGLEKNYLRAQIARISSCTLVSPIGFFKFDEEGEEEEEGDQPEGGGRDSFIEDPDYEGLNLRDLTDPGVATWVHHTPYILTQGRITWFNPLQITEGEEENEEEEERNEPDEPEPEHGPPLLTPISEDVAVGKSPAWLAKISSQFVPEYAVAVLHSNIWPGAYAFAADKGRFFENVYIGWAQKNLESEFEPALPEPPIPEFPTGPEVIEADDPTPETEAAVRAAMREKEMDAQEEDEELGELEAEEEEEEDGED